MADAPSNEVLLDIHERMVENAKSMGANAVVGVALDYEVVGEGGSMMMVVASGTAVKID